MTKTKLPRSLRKYIRKEKSRLRRAFSDPAEHEKAILELLQRVKHPRAIGVMLPRETKSLTEEAQALSKVG